jgi:AcrR family transcriptional regulator
MSKGTTTRAAILKAAVETACLNGFNRLNLQPLAEQVGLTKSGLYAHFGSKAALQAAALERAAELFRDTVLAPVKSAPPGLPRIEAVFDRWLAWPASAALPGHCPFLAAALELEGTDGALRAQLARLFRDFRHVLEQLLGAAVRRGHLGPMVPAALIVQELVGLRYAHHWAAGFMRDPEALLRTRAALAALLARAAAGPRQE